jgi:alkaline phosphatase D
MQLDRRSLLQAGMFGLGAFSVPGCGAARLLTAKGFTHDVASGEPRQRSVMLWTRFVPASGDSARVGWEVSRTSDFAKVVAHGDAVASGEHDYTVKPVVQGLQPGRWYYYRFRAGGGQMSPIGRTRTLPEGPVDNFRFALFSCSNIGFGFFNAYAHAAAREDLHLAVHVGDYFYEYERGKYPDLGQAVRADQIDPPTEIVHLADYRLRYAAYRTDPDLRGLHRRLPMIAMWDDHESANDSWQGGAQNHQPETEGPWSARKAAAVRAYREWMPVNGQTWEDYDVGELATIFRPETRLTGRSHQLDLFADMKGKPDAAAELVRFRDQDWSDPKRTMMGAEQERWLADRFKRSTARRAKWQVLAQEVVMGTMATPPEAAGWLKPDANAGAREANQLRLAASRAGLPWNFDSWDGYPAARKRLLQSALEANSNLVVLSGDSHNAWGFDLDVDGTPAGVEFGGHSVTSPGFENSISNVPPADLARSVIARNPQLKWANTSQRGYVTVELTPTQASGEWLFLDTVRQRSTALAGTHRMSVHRGTNKFA